VHRPIAPATVKGQFGRMAPVHPATDRLPRVTVLAGFLGAGKTTLLRHLLAQRAAEAGGNRGKKWAAIVNDVAALNIDAAVVRQDVAAGQVVELGNGCVCCSSRDDLAESMVRLAADGDYEHILVETSGVAEPRGIANLFVQRNPFGRSVGDVAQLAALVTVVDAAVVAAELDPPAPGAPRALVSASGPRPVSELMIEQIECADVVVINQVDRVDAAQLERVRQVITGLNPRADVCETEQGQVAVEFLLGRDRFDPAATLRSAAWITALNAVVPPLRKVSAPAEAPDPAQPGHRWVARSPEPRHEERFAIRSFVYQARQPFRRDAFRHLIERGLPGLLRAKGFYWLQEQPDEMGFLSVAGGAARFDVLNPWWAALIEAGRATLADRPAMMQALWVEPHGDRRQELVFIGVGLDEAAVRAALDQCLVPRGEG
jgi:G3E family GTPase